MTRARDERPGGDDSHEAQQDTGAPGARPDEGAEHRHANASDARLTTLLRADTPVAYTALRELRERHRPSVLAYARLCGASESSARELATQAFTMATKETARGVEPTVPWRHQLLLLTVRVAATWTTDGHATGLAAALRPVLDAAGPDGPVPPMLAAFQSLPPRPQGLVWYGAVEEEPDDRTAVLLGLTADDVTYKREAAVHALRQACLRARLAASDDPRCQDFRRLIEESVRPDNPRHSTDLRAHMEHCVHCAGAYEELCALRDSPRTTLAEGLLPWGGTAYTRGVSAARSGATAWDRGGTRDGAGAASDGTGAWDGGRYGGAGGHGGGVAGAGAGAGASEDCAEPESGTGPGRPQPGRPWAGSRAGGWAGAAAATAAAAEAWAESGLGGGAGVGSGAGAGAGSDGGAGGGAGDGFGAGADSGAGGKSGAGADSGSGAGAGAGGGSGAGVDSGSGSGSGSGAGAGVSAGSGVGSGSGSGSGSSPGTGLGTGTDSGARTGTGIGSGFGGGAGSGSGLGPGSGTGSGTGADINFGVSGTGPGAGPDVGFGSDSGFDSNPGSGPSFDGGPNFRGGADFGGGSRVGVGFESGRGQNRERGPGSDASGWDRPADGARAKPGGDVFAGAEAWGGPGTGAEAWEGPGAGAPVGMAAGVGAGAEAAVGTVADSADTPGRKARSKRAARAAAGAAVGVGEGAGGWAAAGDDDRAAGPKPGGGWSPARRLVLTSVALGVALAPLLAFLVFSGTVGSSSSDDNAGSVGTPAAPPSGPATPTVPSSPTPSPTPSESESPSEPPEQEKPTRSPGPTPSKSGPPTPQLPYGPPLNGAYTQVVNVGSGLCLDIRGELEKGTDVVTATCSSRATQRWRVDSGRDALQSFADPDLCLDSRGATDDGVGIWDCDSLEGDNGDNLRFEVDSRGMIRPAIAQGHAVTPDALGSVSFAEASGRDGQRWRAGAGPVHT
ncbi:RICIN domain-containing protein [Streptomyces phaeolivaceus]|uniref:RICIN domain-containing protein n=1 Tax=Streptomyces phaeolivaceus TaxID=2653200 RepID=UPI00299F8922|nr:RICIN domain-containing protein [Streptomyces phaeolivaceus]